MALINKTGIGTGNTIQAEHITRVIDALNESGSATIIATGSFTGSFTGDGSGLTGITSAATASYAQYAVSASYEINYETSSSYADFAKTASYITLPAVLTAGNTTSGNNIQVTDNDYLEIGSAGPTWQFKKNSVNGWLEVYNSDEGYNTQIFDQEYFYSQGIEVSERIKFRVGGYGSANPSGDLLTTITAGRAWTLPDASGTIALTTDTPASASYAVTADTASYINVSNIDGEVIATTASYVETAQTASYVLGSNVSGTVATATSSSYTTDSKQLIGTSRSVYTFTTADGTTPYTIFIQGSVPGSNASRYIKATVVGRSGSNALGAVITKVIDLIVPSTENTIFTDGALAHNFIGGPTFNVGFETCTATGVAGTTINWKVIIEYFQYS